MNDQISENGSDTSAGSSSLDVKRLVFLLLGVLLVLVVVGGVAAYFLWPRSQATKSVEPQAVVERIGPRSMMQGISVLQEQHKARTGRYSGNIEELWGAYKAAPEGLSTKLVEALEGVIVESNLLVRTIPKGFEIALRQDTTRWLVFLQAGDGDPKVSSQVTDGSPPFAIAGLPRVASEVKVQELVEFKDSLGFFTVMLPGGFSVDDGSKGQITRISFSYDNGVRMTIKAMEVSHEWDPGDELVAKAEQISSKAVPAFAEFDLSVTNLITVEGATGYEMGLVGREGKEGMQTHSIVLGGDATTLSIALICSVPDGAVLYEALVSSIRDTFRAEEGPSAARRNARKAAALGEGQESPAVPGEPVLTPEQLAQWSEARALLKTSGIMKSGNAYVALVNDRLVNVNETVTVAIKGKPFRFLVTSITVDQVDFEPVLSTPEADQGRVRM